MALLQLEPNETCDLIARCRKNGVTIISALTTAFLAARQEVLGPLPEDKRTIGIPFDLRRHLGENIEEAFCFFAGDFNLQFSYSLEKSILGKCPGAAQNHSGTSEDARYIRSGYEIF